jgi:hypothetical protein
MRWRLQIPGWAGAAAMQPLRLCLCLAALLPFVALAQPSAPSEYEIKAVWLLNFARYVEWPTNAFASPRAPVVVGIFGPNPFGVTLEKTFSGKTVSGRPLAIKRLGGERDAQGCHLIFFPNSERKRQREMLVKQREAAVLTVGESDDFLGDGGIIQFVRKEDTIRFAVNLEPARPARLNLSANLVKIAVLVKGRHE